MSKGKIGLGERNVFEKRNHFYIEITGTNDIFNFCYKTV